MSKDKPPDDKKKEPPPPPPPKYPVPPPDPKLVEKYQGTYGGEKKTGKSSEKTRNNKGINPKA